ncbi:putative transposase, partial [Escherichia coli EC1737]
MTKNTR